MELGTEYGDHGLPDQPSYLHAGIAAGTVAQGNVHLSGREVHQVQACRQPDVDLGIGRLETPQSRHQPLGGEGRRGGEGKPPTVHRCGQQGSGLGEPVEGLPEGGQGGLGRVRQQEPLGRPAEEGRAYIVLQVLDLLRHGTRRDRKLICRPGEVEVARSRLEGAQGVEGR